MKRNLLGLALLIFSVGTAANDLSTTSVEDSQSVLGMLSVESSYTVSETAERFEALITSDAAKSKGMMFIARINHTENAANASLSLRDTEIIMFGNPKIGTPLMQCSQSIAIDLPQKVLFWQDETGKVWLSYNSPQYLKQRHKVTGCDGVFDKISKVLANLSTQASMP